MCSFARTPRSDSSSKRHAFPNSRFTIGFYQVLNCFERSRVERARLVRRGCLAEPLFDLISRYRLRALVTGQHRGLSREMCCQAFGQPSRRLAAAQAIDDVM